MPTSRAQLTDYLAQVMDQNLEKMKKKKNILIQDTNQQKRPISRNDLHLNESDYYPPT